MKVVHVKPADLPIVLRDLDFSKGNRKRRTNLTTFAAFVTNGCNSSNKGGEVSLTHNESATKSI